MSVLFCTDLSGKELHRQIAVCRVVTSGNLGGLMVTKLIQNARDVSSIITLGAIFPIFITPETLVAMTRIL